MKYAVNEEGVEAMKSMATAVTGALEQLESEISNVRDSADEYQDTIGPHKESLESALESIGENIKRASEPAGNVASILKDVAEAYEDVIGNDRFASGK